MGKSKPDQTELKKRNGDFDLSDNINKCVETFLTGYKHNFSRYRSYDFVHKPFTECIRLIYMSEEGDEISEPDWDFLAQKLYMFLASWGMLRNSFMLDNNYKCLINICKLIVCGEDFECCSDGKIKLGKKNYAWLLNVDLLDNGQKEKGKTQDNYIDDVSRLIGLIREIFKSEDLCHLNKDKDESDNSKDSSSDATDTLVTKILLATLGCIPAYDNYVRASLRYLGYHGTITKGGLNSLLKFVKDHKEVIMDAQKTYEPKRADDYNGDMDVTYSTMKYVDMILWEYADIKQIV